MPGGSAQEAEFTQNVEMVNEKLLTQLLSAFMAGREK